MKPNQPFSGPGPDVPFAIFQQTIHSVENRSFRCLLYNPIRASHASEPTRSSRPYLTAPVLYDAVHHVIGKACGHRFIKLLFMDSDDAPGIAHPDIAAFIHAKAPHCWSGQSEVGDGTHAIADSKNARTCSRKNR